MRRLPLVLALLPRITWTLVPPKPNELTAVRRTCSPRGNGVSLSAITNGLLAKSIFGFGFLKCSVGGICSRYKHQRGFDQARDSCGIRRMADVSLDGAEIAKLLLVRLAFKYAAQRLEFDRIADRSARAMGLDVVELSR